MGRRTLYLMQENTFISALLERENTQTKKYPDIDWTLLFSANLFGGGAGGGQVGLFFSKWNVLHTWKIYKVGEQSMYIERGIIIMALKM